jgi:hypothetical protein
MAQQDKKQTFNNIIRNNFILFPFTFENDCLYLRFITHHSKYKL